MEKQGIPQKSFEERKRKWLDKKFPPGISEESPNIRALPLRIQSLATLFATVPDAELLDIKTLLDNERKRRVSPLEIVLKRKRLRSCWDSAIIFELKIPMLRDYIREKFLKLNPQQREDLFDFGVYALEYYSQYEDLSDDEHGDYLIRLSQTADSTGLRENTIEDMIDAILTSHEEPYFSGSPENQYLIEALKNLAQRGIEVESMMIYQIDIPLGAKYAIEYNDKYGEYPVILDC